MTIEPGVRVRVGVSGLPGGGVTTEELEDEVAGLAPGNATYITQTANGILTNEQALGSLATGILKNTTTTGVLSIAVGADLPSHTHTGVVFTMQFNISSGAAGTDVPTGEKPDAEICIPVNCTITDYSMVGTPKTGQTSGSATVALWSDSHTNYPPASGDIITASAPITISSNVKNLTNSRTGWTNTLLASNFIRPNVVTCTNLASLRITLFLTRDV